MKKIKKLALNKEVVSILDGNDMNRVKGGTFLTRDCFSMNITVCLSGNSNCLISCDETCANTCAKTCIDAGTWCNGGVISDDPDSCGCVTQFCV